MTDLKIENYMFDEKSLYVAFTIIYNDLLTYDNNLKAPIEDIQSFIYKLQNVRNVFVSLKNLKDMLDNKLLKSFDKSATKALKKQLDFVNFIRNKSIAHLDLDLLTRASQWSPQIFIADHEKDSKQIILECYKASIEASINAYIAMHKQETFKNEIDLYYPPDAEQFFKFLENAIQKSLSWLNERLNFLAGKFTRISVREELQLYCIAGSTNFNLNEPLSLGGEITEERLKEIQQGFVSGLNKHNLLTPELESFNQKLYEVFKTIL